MGKRSRAKKLRGPPVILDFEINSLYAGVFNVYAFGAERVPSQFERVGKVVCVTGPANLEYDMPRAQEWAKAQDIVMLSETKVVQMRDDKNVVRSEWNIYLTFPSEEDAILAMMVL